MSTPSDTPRTDAESYNCDGPVGANFARQLERELAESRAYADKLAAGLPVGMLPKDIELLRDSNTQLAARVKELEGENAVLRARIYQIQQVELPDAIRSAMKQGGTR